MTAPRDSSGTIIRHSVPARAKERMDGLGRTDRSARRLTTSDLPLAMTWADEGFAATGTIRPSWDAGVPGRAYSATTSSVVPSSLDRAIPLYWASNSSTSSWVTTGGAVWRSRIEDTVWVIRLSVASCSTRASSWPVRCATWSWRPLMRVAQARREGVERLGERRELGGAGRACALIEVAGRDRGGGRGEGLDGSRDGTCGSGRGDHPEGDGEQPDEHGNLGRTGHLRERIRLQVADRDLQAQRLERLAGSPRRWLVSGDSRLDHRRVAAVPAVRRRRSHHLTAARASPVTDVLPFGSSDDATVWGSSSTPALELVVGEADVALDAAEIVGRREHADRLVGLRVQHRDRDEHGGRPVAPGPS